jgi:hypothetical protein
MNIRGGGGGGAVDYKASCHARQIDSLRSLLNRAG